MRAATVLLLALCAASAAAQTLNVPTLETGAGAVGILPLGARNGVFVLEPAPGGRLYVGPRLVTIDADGRVGFPGADRAFDPPIAVDARVFALAARGADVVAGLGFADTQIDADEPPATAAGFAVSADNGRTWRYRFPALDGQDDTQVRYGRSVLPAVPVVSPTGAAPLDVALTSRGIFAATGFGGLRRSTDGGATWARVVLPPDTLAVLDPRETYAFPYEPAQGVRPDSTAPTAALNFVPYAVIEDATGVLWVGTASGINRSVDVPGEADPAWLRVTPTLLGGGVVGSLGYALAERPGAPGEVWAAVWPSGERAQAPDEGFAVVVRRDDDADGFPVFEPVLRDVQVFSLAFGPEGTARVYAAAGTAGLVRSDDGGAAWRTVRTFRDAAGRALPLGPRAGVFAVAETSTGLWVGTTDGLLRSVDGGQSWALLRAGNAPGDSTGRAVPDVSAYAYPNPFLPRRDGRVRIRLDLPAPESLTVRVFDTAMTLVRTLDAPGRPAGPNEIDWDGLDGGGLRVPNGAYVYVVGAGGRQLSGRILVIE